eukprot:scaffold569_cov408-Prasinococcus_capsulatus_cf.AAC.53
MMEPELENRLAGRREAQAMHPGQRRGAGQLSISSPPRCLQGIPLIRAEELRARPTKALPTSKAPFIKYASSCECSFMVSMACFLPATEPRSRPCSVLRKERAVSVPLASSGANKVDGRETEGIPPGVLRVCNRSCDGI